MEVVFGDDNLDMLETDLSFKGGVPPPVVKVYRKRMQIIRASARLNDQYRLVLELIKNNPMRMVVRIVSIEDYH